MTRTEKITDLLKVGFSATELSRSSNELLDETYESAKPLMAAKAEEVRRVLNRENARSTVVKRHHEAVAAQQRASGEWNRKWVHPCEQYPLGRKTESEEHRDIRLFLEKAEAQHTEYKRLFRETGDHTYSAKANDAAATLRYLREELSGGMK